MIKINLAKGGVKSDSSSAPAGDANFPETMDPEARNQAVLRLVILALGPVALFLYSSMVVIPEKEGLFAIKTKLLAELTKKNDDASSAVTEMTNFEQAEAKLKQQIGVIEALRHDRQREVKLLDLVQREMPEHMWISKVDLTTDKMHLEGVAGSNLERNQLVDSLTKSNILKEVNLIKTNEEMIEGNKLESFSLECQFPTYELKPPGKG